MQTFEKNNSVYIMRFINPIDIVSGNDSLLKTLFVFQNTSDDIGVNLDGWLFFLNLFQFLKMKLILWGHFLKPSLVASPTLTTTNAWCKAYKLTQTKAIFTCCLDHKLCHCLTPLTTFRQVSKRVVCHG